MRPPEPRQIQDCQKSHDEMAIMISAPASTLARKLTASGKMRDAYARHWKPSTRKRNESAIFKEILGAFGEPLAVRIPDAVRMTGIGRSKLYELIASGDLETIKVGRCTLVTVEALKALLAKAWATNYRGSR